jgi:hypothetical protein
VGTVSHDTPQRHEGRQPRGDRCARADRCAPSRARRAQGLSQRHAAQELQGPRTPLPAWRTWQDPLARCPDVARCCPSGPGRAWVPRLVLAVHLVCGAGGACGMRLAGRGRTLRGRDRGVAASSGAQPQGTGQVAAALVASRHSATARWAPALPRQALTVPQDATVTGGLCLVPLAPDSHGILVAPRAPARAHPSGPARRAPALAPRHGQGLPAPRAAAPGLGASGAPSRSAPPAPAFCQGPPARRKAVAAPLAIEDRAAPTAAAAAPAPRAQGHTPLHPTGGAPAQRAPGRPPQAPVRLEHAEPARDAARRAPARGAPHRAPGSQRLRAIGQAAHGGARERGGRRHGQRLAAESLGHSAPARALAHHAGRSQRCGERSEHAARVVPPMPAPSACGAREVRPQVAQRDVTQPASCALPATLIPSFARDRVAQPRTVSAGAPLRERAEHRCAPWCEPGGALRAGSPEAQDPLHDAAKRLAAGFQRSRAPVEGRNGSVSRRNHQRRGLDLPRTRQGCTAMHHFFLTRPAGTTAAERLFGQTPRSMCAAIVASVALPPAPLSPPRRAYSGRSHDRGPIARCKRRARQ